MVLVSDLHRFVLHRGGPVTGVRLPWGLISLTGRFGRRGERLRALLVFIFLEWTREECALLAPFH